VNAPPAREMEFGPSPRDLPNWEVSDRALSGIRPTRRMRQPCPAPFQPLYGSPTTRPLAQQGIDSRDEQAEVLFTVHGLVDSLYVKELAKKTHRGLESRVLKGLHAGGRCFGYRNVPSDDGVRLEVDATEAELVRRIFEMSASGLSLKTIAKTLNAEKILSPRPRAGKQYASWAPTAIHAMIRRELYVGKVIWNQSRWVKAPGSNKRLRRPRPQSEWRVMERPELRIVSEDLWTRVHQRQAWVKETYGTQKREGLLNRGVSSRYLLSGFMRCGLCGANLVIVSGRSGDRHPRYGCPQNFYRGTCANDLKERRDWLEDQLLSKIQNEVLNPKAIERAIDGFGRQLRAALGGLSEEMARMREQKAKLESEIANLTAAVAAAGHSPALLSALAEREGELQVITDRLLSEGKGSIEADLEEMRRLVIERVGDLRRLLSNKDVALARTELGKHVTPMTMEPDLVRRHYTAKGEWSLVGNREFSGRVGLVAGAGLGPSATPSAPFSFSLLHAA
jgi:site-specific DNA recombinase